MMHALIGDVQRIALIIHATMHQLDRCGLIVIGSQVHALYTESLVVRPELSL